MRMQYLHSQTEYLAGKSWTTTRTMSSGYNIEWQPENQDLLAIRCGHLTAMMTTCRNINTCDSCWNIPTAGCKTNPPDLLPSQLVVNSIILYATRDYIRLCWCLCWFVVREKHFSFAEKYRWSSSSKQGEYCSNRSSLPSYFTES